jgi:uncharacterized protein with GYD domain
LRSGRATTDRRRAKSALLFEEASHTTYVVLAKYTDQGAKAIAKTVERERASREEMQQYGITMTSIYWTHGRYDMVATFEAPSDQAMTEWMFRLASLGNVRTETLRAFTESEIETVVKQLS